MTASLAPSALPDWPRGLSPELAAAYIGVSAATLRRIKDAPKPIQVSPGRIIYLKDDLDAWLDARAGRAPASPEANGWDG